MRSRTNPRLHRMGDEEEPEHLRGLEAVQRAGHIRFAQRPGTIFPWSEYKDSFERSPS